MECQGQMKPKKKRKGNIKFYTERSRKVFRTKFLDNDIVGG